MKPDGKLSRLLGRLGLRRKEPEAEGSNIELLHPFYLDTDISMAFAAALAGGVALEREEIERSGKTSEAVRNLRGNLRVAGALAGAEAGSKKVEERESTSRLVRRNTEASIFISLHQELRDTQRLADPGGELVPGDIISMEMGPAVAPLRRVVEQVVRLLDFVGPMAAPDPEEKADGRGQTTESARAEGKALLDQGAETDSDEWDPAQAKAMFQALLNDLDQSGMIDVVVKREAEPNIVLTLDRRLVTEQTTELLHTSRFTVVGKVTQVWSDADDGINLYRRSVMSLVPALTKVMGLSMLAMLINLASEVDEESAEKTVNEALGIVDAEGSPLAGAVETATESGLYVPGHIQANADERNDVPEITAESAQAILPWLEAPIVQVLPLAICT